MTFGIGTEENIFLTCVFSVVYTTVKQFSMAFRAAENSFGFGVIVNLSQMAGCAVVVKEEHLLICVLAFVEAGHIGTASLFGDSAVEEMTALGTGEKKGAVLKVVAAKMAALAEACAGPKKGFGIVFAAAAFERRLAERAVVNWHGHILFLGNCDFA